MSPQLPFDVLEHILTYLRTDQRTFAVCSLVCRDFRAITRALKVPQKEVETSMSERCLETPAIKEFLDDIAAHPERVEYLDKLTLVYHAEDRQHDLSLPMAIDAIVTFCQHLPDVRRLELRSFVFKEPALYGLITLAGRIPTLESLQLCLLEVPEQSPPWPHASVQSWSASEGGSSSWALWKLHLEYCTVPAAELRKLVSFLEESHESIPLQSLALRASLFHRDPVFTENRPGAPHRLGLRSYSTTVNDIDMGGKVYKPGRKSIRAAVHMQPLTVSPHLVPLHHLSGKNINRLMLDLQRCSTLRSLRLDYDAALCFCLAAWNRRGKPRVPIRLPPYFVKALASTLHPWPWGTPPMPELEVLYLVIHAPQDWLVRWKSAFGSLAKTLVGDAHKPREKRRYPKFCRLEVHSIILPYLAVHSYILGVSREDEIRLQTAAREDDPLRRMLQPFVDAGIDVHTAYD
ncbi:hypothetical protein ACG7TL_008991 [Trametes sanguinea]